MGIQVTENNVGLWIVFTIASIFSIGQVVGQNFYPDSNLFLFFLCCLLSVGAFFFILMKEAEWRFKHDE